MATVHASTSGHKHVSDSGGRESTSGGHRLMIGYAIWLLGFFGAHRFYYGRVATGVIWFFTFGLFGIGWLVDLFLIPSMDRSAARKYASGVYDYDVSWLLLTFLGVFGVHRFYLGKWFTGILYLLTGAVFGLGWLLDFCTLNAQVHERNVAAESA